MQVQSGVLPLLLTTASIWSAFLLYGHVQESIFTFVSPDDNSKFTFAWFLQACEALVNIAVGYLGMMMTGKSVGSVATGVDIKGYGITGFTQVSAKALTSLALAKGLSFPVATLAKSGKMAPVMAGSLIIGGTTYSTREYSSVAAIILGTCLVSASKTSTKTSPPSSFIGVFCILCSLACDGITGGLQKRMKKKLNPSGFEFMFYTNLSMAAVATLVALVVGDISSALSFLSRNPEVKQMIVKFTLCSALGQSAIFFSVSFFDPLATATITTTRKIASVLLSIWIRGHIMGFGGWFGVLVASAGILSDVEYKWKNAQVRTEASVASEASETRMTDNHMRIMTDNHVKMPERNQATSESENQIQFVDFSGPRRNSAENVDLFAGIRKDQDDHTATKAKPIVMSV